MGWRQRRAAGATERELLRGDEWELIPWGGGWEPRGFGDSADPTVTGAPRGKQKLLLRCHSAAPLSAVMNGSIPTGSAWLKGAPGAQGSPPAEPHPQRVLSAG